MGISPNAAVTDVKKSDNFSPGRPAGDPNQIVVHHWGADGYTHDGVVAHLCRPDGDSSAHYVASAGRVTQLVSDADRAWHAGRSGNPRGIGIECRPEMSAGDIATVQGLIKAIWAEHGHLPVVGHRDHMATACPGRWYGILGELNAGTAGGHAAPPAEIAPPDSEAYRTGYGYIKVDGVEGPEMWSRFRRVMGHWYPAPWENAVKQLQFFLSDAISSGQQRDLIGGILEKDGVEGPKTTKLLQWYLWHNGPNRGSKPPSNVWRTYAPGWGLWDFVDGVKGEATIAVFQEALNYSVAESGKLMTWKG